MLFKDKKSADKIHTPVVAQIKLTPYSQGFNIESRELCNSLGRPRPLRRTWF